MVAPYPPVKIISISFELPHIKVYDYLPECQLNKNYIVIFLTIGGKITLLLWPGPMILMFYMWSPEFHANFIFLMRRVSVLIWVNSRYF